MDVEGLTRENIASHLQKYRRLLEKKAGIAGPVSSKDWPKLEAVQTQHLHSLRKQLREAPDAHPASAPALESAAAMQPAPATTSAAAAVHTPTTDADAPTAPLPAARMDAQTTPPPVAPPPVSAELPPEHVPGMEMMWQVQPAPAIQLLCVHSLFPALPLAIKAASLRTRVCCATAGSCPLHQWRFCCEWARPPAACDPQGTRGLVQGC